MKLINTSTGIVEFFGAQADFEGVEFYDTYLDDAGNAARKNQQYLIELDDAEKQAERKAEQFKGVEFQGVKCSSTKDDQFGLTGIWMQYESLKAAGKAAEFVPQSFHFENGNVLVLTKDNIEAFRAVWLPFRMSFFPLPEVA